MGHEDLKGHVEFGGKRKDEPGLDKKVEKEASAEMFLVKGKRKLAFPENLFMC